MDTSYATRYTRHSNPLVKFLVGLFQALVPFSLGWIDSGWLVALLMVAHSVLILGVFLTIEPEDGTPVILGLLCEVLAVIVLHLSGRSATSAYAHWLPVWAIMHIFIISLIRRKRAA